MRADFQHFLVLFCAKIVKEVVDWIDLTTVLNDFIMQVWCRKPVATLMKAQEVLDNQGEIVKQSGKGRHDPCVVPRAVPIVEAMTALVLAEAYLTNRTTQI